MKIDMKKGFTLIEVLVATTVLVMVGVAVIVLEKQFIGSGTTNKHRMEATALATGGVNMVKQIYNTNLINTPTTSNALWLNLGINADTMPDVTKTYYLNTSNHLSVCTGTPPCQAGTPSTDPWKIADNNNNIFTRTITFTPQSVTVTVSWLEGTRPEKVESKTVLKDVR